MQSSQSPTKAEFVRLVDVTKDFSGVRALSGVSLTAYCGEVLALLGENGAGKSTLMNILSGTYPEGTYGGEIFLRGGKVSFRNPADAEKCGITIIHQELSSFAHLSVAENLWVGHWPTRRGLVDWKKMEESATLWLDRVGAKIDPRLLMSELSVGSQQLVEIAKALSKNSQLLILDEPTSSLTPKEVENLYGLVRQLRSEGKALIYISHKMDEIFALADRITVLRDGKSVASAPIGEVTEAKLITHMVGRSMDQLYPPPPVRAADFKESAPVLRVKNLRADALDSPRSIGPVSFELKRGEILGFAGLLGSGRTELVQAIIGGRPDKYKVSGEVYVNGERLHNHGPRTAIQHGIGLIGEDRKRDSILDVRSLSENASVSRLVSNFLGRVLNTKNEREITDGTLKRLRTRYSDQTQAIKELSGGNQQKVVIGRVLETSPDIIILDEPTRGVDVGAKFEIYQILFELAESGKSLIVVSSDLPELIALADRIIVLSDGNPTGQLERNEFSQETIMRMAIQSSKVLA